MKTLHLRRHSMKDGANDTIGPKGLALAKAEGEKKTGLGVHEVGDGPDAMYVNNAYARIFHGVLIRTLQTVYGFAQGLGYTPTLMPMVKGLGDQATFVEMVNDAFKSAVKDGKSNLAALGHAHSATRVSSWAKEAVDALESMFDQMTDDEVAIGFFHSPTIELAAANCVTFGTALPKGWDDLKEMDGLVFVQNRIPMVSGIEVIQVIRAQRESESVKS